MFDRMKSDWQRSGVGSTGKDHPFRQRIQRQVRLAELKAEQRRQVTLEELVYTFGIPLGDDFGDPDGLSDIERFEGEHGMEHRGVDTVLSAYSDAFKSGNFEAEEN